MKERNSAPLLSRVKSWQLIALGISGWVTLYSAAIITWGTSSTIVGNTQGSFFAVTMGLAGLESKRFKKSNTTPTDPLQWVGDITAEQLNQTITQVMREQAFRVEAPHAIEANMGFGVRAVKAGRTLVFETGRWQEPVIDLLHAKTTEENRKKVFADFAILVGVGTPDEDTRIFVKTHPVQLLVGEELKNMLVAENPPVQTVSSAGVTIKTEPDQGIVSDNQSS